MKTIWDAKKEFLVVLDKVIGFSYNHNKVSGEFDVICLVGGLGPVHVDSRKTEQEAKLRMKELADEEA